MKAKSKAAKPRKPAAKKVPEWSGWGVFQRWGSGLLVLDQGFKSRALARNHAAVENSHGVNFGVHNGFYRYVVRPLATPPAKKEGR